MIMSYERHPAVDLVRQKILFLIDEWIARGYSPEKIGEMCGLSKVHIYAIMKLSDRPGGKGYNLTLNTAFKIWTGLGNPLDTLLADCDVDYSDMHSGIDIAQILTVSKQVLELDATIMETVLKRRAITRRKMEQLESLLATVRELLADLQQIIAVLEERSRATAGDKKSLEAANQPPQTSPAPPPSRKKTRKG